MRLPYTLIIVLALCPVGVPQPGEAPKPKLLIAFASFKHRPKQPTIHFYEHDGVGEGKIVGSIDTINLRSDSHPALSRDGRWCVFASELENQKSRIFLWDRSEKKLVTPPLINDSPNAQIHPTISGDGQVIAFAAFDRSGFSQRWDIVAYDVQAKKLLELPKLNTTKYDERMPCLSADGRWLAYTSNAPGGAGLTDIYLYDRTERKVVALPEMNSPGLDMTPSLSEDGNLVCFVSDRPGGAGGRDIYLYDRKAKNFLPLPGLNSAAHEQTPSLSHDGRYIAFVSERVSGLGERDIFLYDRDAKKLLPTPGINSKREELDPCVIVLK
jgi:Tol biopolymer transport system component